MKILYTPVGDTDPIRGFRDGGMLHIVRHYHPDKVIMFMTKDMVEKENFDHRYTKALLSVNPHLLIDSIKTDIIDPHHIDSLDKLVSNFINLHKLALPEDIFYLNLSSGTPQMKMIMAFLGREYSQTVAIQVDSPMKGSNRNNPAFGGKKEKDLSLEELISSNEDNEPEAPNRCSEPAMDYIRKVIGRNELLTLVNAYEYSAAREICKKYKKKFSPTTVTLLKHAANRILLNAKDADRYAQKIYDQINNPVLDLHSKVIEQFMVLELHARKKDGYSFVMKLTPVITEVVKTKMEELGFVFSKMFVIDYKGVQKLSFKLLQANYPEVHSYIVKNYQGLTDNSPLSLSNLVVILSAYPEHKQFVDQLKPFRELERNLRNTYAHKLEGAHVVIPHRQNVSFNKFITRTKMVKYELVLSDLREIMNFKEENVYDIINKIIADTIKY